MKIKIVHILPILIILILPVQAQDDVALFNYWKFYSDAENSMYKSSCELAFKQLDRRKAAISDLNSKSEYEKRQVEVRKKLSKLIGKFPEKTPLNAQVTGIIKKDDYHIEKLIYESMPGYYVTAALFIPSKPKGKKPAIIYASGHTANGFRSETYQHVIINLVKKGFVVLAFDPIGQGERLQYYNETEGKSRFGATVEHSYPGAQCYISGYSPTKYFVWDGIRSIDYLLARKEVDPNRIGMTGRSGGGTQTAYIAAMDDRILAAAPECFITSMEYVLKSIGPQDAEQNLIHMISEGLDHADLLEVRAPKPCLMITTTRDFFSIQGARETFKETKQFYTMIGNPENMEMVEDDDGHASTKKNREAMYAFFQKHLDNTGDPTDLDVHIIEEKELWATRTGQLATSLGGESLFSLNKNLVRTQVALLKHLRSTTEFDKRVTKVTDDVKNLSGFKNPVNFGKAVFSGRYKQENYLLEKYLIPGSGDYMLSAALYLPVDTKSDELILLLDEKGMAHAANEDSLIYSLVLKGYPVLLFDVPGIGSLGPGYLKGDAYIDNTSYNQWFASILTNKSIVAIRAEDILRVTHFAITNVKENSSLTFISVGSIGSELLHAAIFDENIDKVCLVNPFISFANIAIAMEYSPSFIPSTVAGAINKYDLPDLMAALCPRPILILNPLASDGSSVEYNKKSCELSYPKIVYTQKGVANRFSYSHKVDDRSYRKEIFEWLK